MFYLSDEEKQARTEGEVVMWFRQAQEEHQRAEQFAARVRAQNEEIADLKKAIDLMADRSQSDADRFEAITRYVKAAQETGYQTSWSIGGLTLEAICEQTDAARNYRAPSTVLEADLIVVGKIDREGALYRKNVIVPHGSAVEVVYVYRPKTAKLNTDKTSKVKGKPKA